MFILFKAEFYKVIKSFAFKIALLGVLFFSLFHIVNEYSYFSEYDSFYDRYKNEYAKEIKDIKDFLQNPVIDSYFQQHPENFEVETRNRKHYLEFYMSHEMPQLKKDFSQGLSKSIFNYEEFLLLIILFCCNIVCYEKTKNITPLQFASRVSRSELYFSKFLALSVAVTIIFVLNLIISYILSGLLMGFSDLSEPVQALREYRFAPIERSIKEFLILKIIFGWLTCISLVVVFLFISTIAKDVLTSYMISVVMIFMDNVFYLGGKHIKHFIIGTYYAYKEYIYGLIVYDIKIVVLNMMVQTICVYLIGLYIYKKIE